MHFFEIAKKSTALVVAFTFALSPAQLSFAENAPVEQINGQSVPVTDATNPHQNPDLAEHLATAPAEQQTETVSPLSAATPAPATTKAEATNAIEVARIAENGGSKSANHDAEMTYLKSTMPDSIQKNEDANKTTYTWKVNGTESTTFTYSINKSTSATSLVVTGNLTLPQDAQIGVGSFTVSDGSQLNAGNSTFNIGNTTLNGVSQVAGGSTQSLALLSDGTVQGWGSATGVLGTVSSGSITLGSPTLLQASGSISTVQLAQTSQTITLQPIKPASQNTTPIMGPIQYPGSTTTTTSLLTTIESRLVDLTDDEKASVKANLGADATKKKTDSTKYVCMVAPCNQTITDTFYAADGTTVVGSRTYNSGDKNPVYTWLDFNNKTVPTNTDNSNITLLNSGGSLTFDPTTNKGTITKVDGTVTSYIHIDLRPEIIKTCNGADCSFSELSKPDMLGFTLIGQFERIQIKDGAVQTETVSVYSVEDKTPIGTPLDAVKDNDEINEAKKWLAETPAFKKDLQEGMCTDSIPAHCSQSTGYYANNGNYLGKKLESYTDNTGALASIDDNKQLSSDVKIITSVQWFDASGKEIQPITRGETVPKDLASKAVTLLGKTPTTMMVEVTASPCMESSDGSQSNCATATIRQFFNGNTFIGKQTITTDNSGTHEAWFYANDAIVQVVSGSMDNSNFVIQRGAYFYAVRKQEDGSYTSSLPLKTYIQTEENKDAKTYLGSTPAYMNQQDSGEIACTKSIPKHCFGSTTRTMEYYSSTGAFLGQQVSVFDGATSKTTVTWLDAVGNEIKNDQVQESPEVTAVKNTTTADLIKTFGFKEAQIKELIAKGLIKIEINFEALKANVTFDPSVKLSEGAMNLTDPLGSNQLPNKIDYTLRQNPMPSYLCAEGVECKQPAPTYHLVSGYFQIGNEFQADIYEVSYVPGDAALTDFRNATGDNRIHSVKVSHIHNPCGNTSECMAPASISPIKDISFTYDDLNARISAHIDYKDGSQGNVAGRDLVIAHMGDGDFRVESVADIDKNGKVLVKSNFEYEIFVSDCAEPAEGQTSSCVTLKEIILKKVTRSNSDGKSLSEIVTIEPPRAVQKLPNNGSAEGLWLELNFHNVEEMLAQALKNEADNHISGQELTVSVEENARINVIFGTMAAYAVRKDSPKDLMDGPTTYEFYGKDDVLIGKKIVGGMSPMTIWQNADGSQVPFETTITYSGIANQVFGQMPAYQLIQRANSNCKASGDSSNCNVLYQTAVYRPLPVYFFDQNFNLLGSFEDGAKVWKNADGKLLAEQKIVSGTELSEMLDILRGPNRRRTLVTTFWKTENQSVDGSRTISYYDASGQLLLSKTTQKPDDATTVTTWRGTAGNTKQISTISVYPDYTSTTIQDGLGRMVKYIIAMKDGSKQTTDYFYDNLNNPTLSSGNHIVHQNSDGLINADYRLFTVEEAASRQINTTVGYYMSGDKKIFFFIRQIYDASGSVTTSTSYNGYSTTESFDATINGTTSIDAIDRLALNKTIMEFTDPTNNYYVTRFFYKDENNQWPNNPGIIQRGDVMYLVIGDVDADTKNSDDINLSHGLKVLPDDKTFTVWFQSPYFTLDGMQKMGIHIQTDAGYAFVAFPKQDEFTIAGTTYKMSVNKNGDVSFTEIHPQIGKPLDPIADKAEIDLVTSVLGTAPTSKKQDVENIACVMWPCRNTTDTYYDANGNLIGSRKYDTFPDKSQIWMDKDGKEIKSTATTQNKLGLPTDVFDGALNNLSQTELAQFEAAILDVDSNSKYTKQILTDKDGIETGATWSWTSGSNSNKTYSLTRNKELVMHVDNTITLEEKWNFSTRELIEGWPTDPFTAAINHLSSAESEQLITAMRDVNSESKYTKQILTDKDGVETGATWSWTSGSNSNKTYLLTRNKELVMHDDKTTTLEEKWNFSTIEKISLEALKEAISKQILTDEDKARLFAALQSAVNPTRNTTGESESYQWENSENKKLSFQVAAAIMPPLATDNNSLTSPRSTEAKTSVSPAMKDALVEITYSGNLDLTKPQTATQPTLSQNVVVLNAAEQDLVKSALSLESATAGSLRQTTDGTTTSFYDQAGTLVGSRVISGDQVMFNNASNQTQQSLTLTEDPTETDFVQTLLTGKSDEYVSMFWAMWQQMGGQVYIPADDTNARRKKKRSGLD